MSTEPIMAPLLTLTPSSRAADAPMSASSLVPWTVKLICRMTISGEMMPEISPSSAAAMRALWTKPTWSRAAVSEKY